MLVDQSERMVELTAAAVSTRGSATCRRCRFADESFGSHVAAWMLYHAADVVRGDLPSSPGGDDRGGGR